MVTFVALTYDDMLNDLLYEKGSIVMYPPPKKKLN